MATARSPIEVLAGIRVGVASDRSPFYNDRSESFLGATRPDATVSSRLLLITLKGVILER